MSGYNGWKNYETWNCNLWLTNDEGTEAQLHEWAEELKEAHSEDIDKAQYELAERIEAMVDEMTPELGASMFSDMLSASLREVDWDEIAKAVMEA